MEIGAISLICSYSICLRLVIRLLSIATPVGSITKYSGLTVFAIVSTEAAKSPFTEQQIQPSVNSHIFTLVDSLRTSPSTPEVPYSFSKIAISFFVCFASSLINVVLPAPRKPDIISIFIDFL